MALKEILRTSGPFWKRRANKAKLFPGVDSNDIHHHHIGQGRFTIPVLGDFHNKGKYDSLWHNKWGKVSNLFNASEPGPSSVIKRMLVKDRSSEGK
jgi:hypothetical protein